MLQRSLLVLCFVPAAACHRYETVNDLKSVAGSKARITLSPDGRAKNARRLGGVPLDVTGVLIPTSGDSIGIMADEVRFGDLGTVPFARGELRFAAQDVASVATQKFNRKKTTIFAVLGGLGVLAVGLVFGPGGFSGGFGRSDPPTPR